MLYSYYGGSLIKALQDVYPRDWKEWRFDKVSPVCNESSYKNNNNSIFHP